MITSSRAVLTGAIAGLAASVAMNGVSLAWSALTPGSRKPDATSNQGARPDVAESQQNSSSPENELATSKIAARIEEPLRRRRLNSDEKVAHGQFVHYAYGAATGVAYAMVGRKVRTAPASDLAYGLLLWAGGVLIALPALGLIRRPDTYQGHQHALGILGHVAYGLALGPVFRSLNPGCTSSSHAERAAPNW